MNLKNFVGKIPNLCGAVDADNWSKVFSAIFEMEIVGAINITGKTAMERVGFIFNALTGCQDVEKLEQCKNLVILTALAHKAEVHGLELTDEEQVEYQELEALTSSSKVDVGYTTAEAVQGTWM